MMYFKDKYVHIVIWSAIGVNIVYWAILFTQLQGDVEIEMSLAECSYSFLQMVICFLIHKIKDSQYVQMYFLACIITNILFIFFLGVGNLFNIGIMIIFSFPSWFGIFHGLCVTGIILSRRQLRQKNDENLTIELKCWYVLCIILLLGFIIYDFAKIRTLILEYQAIP